MSGSGMDTSYVNGVLFKLLWRSFYVAIRCGQVSAARSLLSSLNGDLHFEDLKGLVRTMFGFVRLRI